MARTKKVPTRRERDIPVVGYKGFQKRRSGPAGGGVSKGYGPPYAEHKVMKPGTATDNKRKMVD